MYRINKSGPRWEPWGIPDFTRKSGKSKLLIFTLRCRLDNYEKRQWPHWHRHQAYQYNIIVEEKYFEFLKLENYWCNKDWIINPNLMFSFSQLYLNWNLKTYGPSKTLCSLLKCALIHTIDRYVIMVKLFSVQVCMSIVIKWLISIFLEIDHEWSNKFMAL